MGLSGAIGDAWEILANVVESVAIWFVRSESAPIRMGASGRAGSSVLVLLLCRTCGDHCCWRSNCGCLDDQFVIVYERRGRFG
jgi:hypothetical protein